MTANFSFLLQPRNRRRARAASADRCADGLQWVLDEIEMDKKAPFVGDQSPVIQLDAKSPHGIRQTGLGLVKGKQYTGRIYLRGTPGAKVNVTLVWGDGASEKQSVAITPLTAEYKKYPLTFTAKADTEEGIIEVTGTGSGSFHIGAISLMPADNIQGFRPDTTALLRKIPMGFWRYGGNYTSNLIWYHIVGDIDKRPPDWDNAWNAMQTNDLGLDEFMTLCKLINVEPYISVNAGLGDSHSAAEEVEYMNGSATTHMGAQRAKNGHAAPYNVKLLEHRQRAMGLMADWPYRSEVLHDEAQRIRQGHAAGRSVDHADRVRHDAAG